MADLPANVVAYPLELLDIGGKARLRDSVHAQRRRLMAQGMTEAEARAWVTDLGFQVGVEAWPE